MQIGRLNLPGLMNAYLMSIQKRKLPEIFHYGQSLVEYNKSLSLSIIAPHRDVLFFGHVAACGILVPDQGWNPCPLQWKLRVLTTGQSGNSLEVSLIDELSLLGGVHCFTYLCSLQDTSSASSCHLILFSQRLKNLHRYSHREFWAG